MMQVDDYVFVINESDWLYGQKFIIRGIQTDFVSRITGYTVSDRGGIWRDYLPTDLQYTTKYRTRFTSQMQLF